MSRNWPELPAYDQWQDTLTTLHMWTQIVGKIRTRCLPWINHSWHSTLYVSAQGLTTGVMPCGDRSLQIDFDFVERRLQFALDDGRSTSIELRVCPVSEFHGDVLDRLQHLGLDVTIHDRPNEVPEAIPFAENSHTAYDADAVHRLWQALVRIETVMQEFRSRFLGKCSPVHFFWGAMDLAVTRFSGRAAPEHPGGFPNLPDWITREAYSHEVSSAGFWAGGGGVDTAAFYSYAYPSPEGFGEAQVAPEAAYFHADLGEFVLPYDAVRAAASPRDELLAFLQSTYEAAATLANWDRGALERAAPPGP